MEQERTLNLSVVNGYIVGFDDGWYIGRPGKGKPGSALANPYHISKDNSREAVIANYRKWLWRKVQDNDAAVMSELNALLELAQRQHVKLVCFCAPKPCHGDVIVKCLHWMLTRSTN